MLNQTDINEVINKGKEDGIRLFNVSTSIYKVLIIFNWILAIGGGLGALVLFGNGLPAQGVVVGILVLVICAITYAGAVLSTHIAKVLVHLLFANLAILNGSEK